MWLDHLARDLRYACRSLARSPLITAAVVLSLAIGIGADTAVFTIANAILCARAARRGQPPRARRHQPRGSRRIVGRQRDLDAQLRRPPNTDDDAGRRVRVRADTQAGGLRDGRPGRGARPRSHGDRELLRRAGRGAGGRPGADGSGSRARHRAQSRILDAPLPAGSLRHRAVGADQRPAVRHRRRGGLRFSWDQPRRGRHVDAVRSRAARLVVPARRAGGDSCAGG